MSDNKNYYYMRLKEDFFDSDELKLLEGEKPDGYMYSNILLKMYLRSLKSGGRLMLNGLIPYNAKMISSLTGHSVGVVEKALDIFEALGLIERLDNGAIYMLNIQNFIGKSSTEADRQREYDRRIAEEKKSLRNLEEILENSTPEIEIEKEIELKIETELETELDTELEENTDGKRQRIDYQAIIDLYNSICISFPKVTKLTDPRKRAIKTMINKVSIDEMRTAFEKAEASDFMKSGTWASFDWMMKESHFVKIIEGNYDNKQSSQPRTAEQERISNRISEVDGWRV